MLPQLHKIDHLVLSSDGDSTLLRWWTDAALWNVSSACSRAVSILRTFLLTLVNTGTSCEEAAFFHWTAACCMTLWKSTARNTIDASAVKACCVWQGRGRRRWGRACRDRITTGDCIRQRRHVWNVVGFGMLCANRSDTGVAGFASFGQCIIA
jgi:hypothetical protein